ncbi:transglutaminase-like domain-containing protein [Tautonia marina]|uniref:transglutaminase-like domain-containing protein n=1 Tax=Tautonia marina TaxID=2653855 RepID=UPI001260C753|nr:transglutaminase-like domain-containing protein [Tautonia marina]
MFAENQRDRQAVGLTIALAAIGVASLELAVCGMTHSTALALLRAGGLVAVMLAAFALLGRGRSDRGRLPTRRETIALLVLAALPLAWHPARIAVLGGGVMLETMLLEGLRNLGLGLAALSRKPMAGRLAAVVALFGVLVGSSLVESQAMTVMAGAFAVIGAGWLLTGYWLGLPTGRVSEGRPPLAGAAVALGVVAAMLAIATVGPTTAATALAGLFPSSGGTDWSDPEARSGVGDGPNEVDARDSADSVGFSQSEVYLETDQPSLYDAFSETFGEPIKKTQEKAIALGPTEIQERREHPSEDHRAGREFSTHRKPPGPRDPPGADADSLLYVRGRAPAHLRLVAYDTFDGASWVVGPPSPSDARLQGEGPDSPWLRVEMLARPYLSGQVRHRVKVGLLETASIPSPAHLERFRVGSVNRVDFYEWAQPGVLRMRGRTIPPGTVIDTEARSPLPESLRRLTFPERPGDAFLRYRQTPEGPPALLRLASEWSAGVPRGWQQVEAVVSQLRGHCTFDRAATPPEDCPDVMAHFLVNTRRGPDYLFATAAALMLRSLGYPTRVVGGLYVDPRRYDPVARHVAVASGDAHLWVEVQVPGGDWVAVEPTPGFDLMPPVRSPLDRVLAGIALAGSWAARNVAGLAMATIGIGLLVWRRREVLDRAWTLAWCLATQAGAPSQAVLATLRLVERRASLAGRARTIGETPSQWCGGIVASAPDHLGVDLQALVRLAQWSAYAPVPLPVDVNCRALCRRVVRGWTLRTFRAIASPDHLTRELAS